jgi:hypothetical protein
MAMQATWNGTENELSVLLHVIAQNCTCRLPTQPAGGCAAHRMLLDQRVVDGLVFAYRVVDKFVVEEFETA